MANFIPSVGMVAKHWSAMIVRQDTIITVPSILRLQCYFLLRKDSMAGIVDDHKGVGAIMSCNIVLDCRIQAALRPRVLCQCYGFGGVKVESREHSFQFFHL